MLSIAAYRVNITIVLNFVVVFQVAVSIIYLNSWPEKFFYCLVCIFFKSEIRFVHIHNGGSISSEYIWRFYFKVGVMDKWLVRSFYHAILIHLSEPYMFLDSLEEVWFFGVFTLQSLTWFRISFKTTLIVSLR
jgi:hypothetical protein